MKSLRKTTFWSCSWHSAQASLLAELEGPSVESEFEPESATYESIALPAIRSLQNCFA